ncbi:uncharacterized protein LOC122852120 [Aphidius gifuensis]|uniref:uncharacterized protein LOC122852120 n=1 Tax=Aphidius gifuensis TaxID=684658 RepID=UPI001CDB8386|nr:uncharacterized protein LOC122852120 [Aphidius gifuensis]
MNILRIITGNSSNSHLKLSKILFRKLDNYLTKSSVKVHNSAKEFKLPATTTSRALARIKHRDGISQEYDIIYRSTMSRYIMYIYPASLVMIVCGFYATYMSFTNIQTVLDSQLIKNIPVSYGNKYEMMFCYFVYYAVNILMCCACVRHPIRIYCNHDKNIYKMITINWRYPFKKITEFTPKNVEKKHRNPWNALMQASHSINGKTYHLMQDGFRSQSHYFAMLGHKDY